MAIMICFLVKAGDVAVKVDKLFRLRMIILQGYHICFTCLGKIVIISR
jgi:hypothetical protein